MAVTTRHVLVFDMRIPHMPQLTWQHGLWGNSAGGLGASPSLQAPPLQVPVLHAQVEWRVVTPQGQVCGEQVSSQKGGGGERGGDVEMTEEGDQPEEEGDVGTHSGGGVHGDGGGSQRHDAAAPTQTAAGKRQREKDTPTATTRQHPPDHNIPPPSQQQPPPSFFAASQQPQGRSPLQWTTPRLHPTTPTLQLVVHVGNFQSGEVLAYHAWQQPTRYALRAGGGGGMGGGRGWAGDVPWLVVSEVTDDDGVLMGVGRGGQTGGGQAGDGQTGGGQTGDGQTGGGQTGGGQTGVVYGAGEATPRSVYHQVDNAATAAAAAATTSRHANPQQQQQHQNINQQQHNQQCVLLSWKPRCMAQWCAESVGVLAGVPLRTLWTSTTHHQGGSSNIGGGGDGGNGGVATRGRLNEAGWQWVTQALFDCMVCYVGGWAGSENCFFSIHML